MALGTSLTITLDGSGGTAKVLPFINNDGYASEYFLDETTEQFRAKVRNSKDSVKAGTQPFDRHNVTFERYLKPTSTYPLGHLTQVQFILRLDPSYGAPAEAVDLSEAMAYYMVKAGGIAAKLLNWES